MKNIANQIKPLPLKDLIGAPFRAAMESQIGLTESTYEFIKLIGFDEDESLKTLDFNVPIANELKNEEVVYKNEKVKVPLLSVLPIPSLMIDKVSVDFQMEIKSSIEKTNKYFNENEDQSKKVKLFSLKKTEVLGKITESRENTRKSNQTAKYQFHVEAKMQDKPEGLQKMLDLIISRMTP